MLSCLKDLISSCGILEEVFTALTFALETAGSPLNEN